MNITITGDIGSGKSTLAKMIAKKLNMRIVEESELRKDFKSITTLSEELMRLGHEEDNIIFVSNFAWYCVPDSYKIYLMINPILAAQRIFEDKHKRGNFTCWQDIIYYNECCKELEIQQWLNVYDIDDPTGYNCANLVMHVGYNSPSTVCTEVLQHVNKHDLACVMDPRIIVPVNVTGCFSSSKINRFIDESKIFCGNCGLYLNKGTVFCDYEYERILACIHKGMNFITVLPPNVRDDIVADYMDQRQLQDYTEVPMQDVFDNILIKGICTPVYENGYLSWATIYERMSEEDVYAFMMSVSRNLDVKRRGNALIPEERFDDLMSYNYVTLLSTSNLCIKGAFDNFQNNRLWLMYENDKGVHQCYFDIDIDKFK